MNPDHHDWHLVLACRWQRAQRRAASNRDRAECIDRRDEHIARALTEYPPEEVAETVGVGITLVRQVGRAGDDAD